MLHEGGGQVEEMHCLVSELADVVANERVMLDECGDLLASTLAMQVNPVTQLKYYLLYLEVEENSLRTHLIQLKQALRKGEQPISVIKTHA
ncbi:hypothetical protein HHK36_013795 [Tetracentron sinense]|uniref:Uncharacterized protein n=1 Tax=Tetracentron sinense TaxID=13715 RepID=A0A834Z6W1_TETSI|nr:hypothetical protein HHK36_013795 [Tetracentron sinense]